MSTPTSSNGLNASGSSPRIPIGRPIADTPQSLAAASPAKLTPASADTTGMGGAQNSEVRPVVVKPVDFKTLTGSYAGDHRTGQVNVPMDAIKNPPSPREQMRGQQDSRNYSENGKAFQSTSNSLDSDAGN